MQIDTGTETVVADIAGGVGTIMLNRPERRNALHFEMQEAVPRLLERFAEDPDVGCIVVTGAGKSFCAGGDVGGGTSRRPSARTDDAPRQPKTAKEQGQLLAEDARMIEMLYASPKITLAALPGSAVGAGMSFALAADLRIAAQSATLIGGWGRLGFSGDFGGTWLLSRMVGPSRALEFLIDNTVIDSARALALGLFNRVVPDVELRAAALAWAGQIAAGPRTAHRFFKENVRQAEHLSLAEHLPLEGERMAQSAMTDDHRKAFKRWMEEAAAKRAAQS
jgi:2-(1,2-epoxy-1,2-dihydrophenyl)acetyl-CoA isomerase